MSEKPIIFSTDMAKAILNSRKTVTRRLDGLNYINEDSWAWECHGKSKEKDGVYFEFFSSILGDGCNIKPRYQKGDILWVKETWRNSAESKFKQITSNIMYKADMQPFEWCLYKWKSSMFMPKKIARIWLEVLDVRPERLQEITETDSIREGALKGYGRYAVNAYDFNYKDGFCKLWDSLNAKRGYPWESNPWVWRIEFTRKA